VRNVVCGFFVLMIALSGLMAQDATYPPQKPTPAMIQPQILFISDSVIRDQWPHTLKLVNAPQNVTLLNPGQCVRVGIYATGDNRDSFLKKTTLSFRIKFAGQSHAFPPASLPQIKQIKPEGGDFVTGALAAGGIKNPLLSTATLGIAQESWCVPADAEDGTGTVEAEVEAPSGHKKLPPSSIQVESFATGSKIAFKDSDEFSSFLETYYRQPNPARLLPALQFLVSDQTQHSQNNLAEIAAAFLSAALKADPAAAKDFQARISSQSPLTRALGLLILRSAGHDIAGVLNSLSADEQEKFKSLPPLEDPYEIPMTQEAFTHLDMLWGVFGATGRFEPVNKIASTLDWRSDYDAFDKMRKSGEHPSQLTPSIVRGLTYMAAGWSLSSFQRNDPLVADYIEYMLASPDISQSVKSELKGLSTNPAFQHPDGK
jgi:hypothetical protein